MASVTLEHIRKVYDNGFEAVREASFEIADGEFIVLVGPSGCGKSTTLRMIAGLESISSGTLRIGNRVVNDVAPKDRDIAMVFQNYALYPHMTIFDNMAFGLKLRKYPKSEIEERVRSAADTLGLEAVLDRKPGQLSGGQRQRVALGRAIVRKPQVFLFDEPLSNLDAKLRVQTRTEISKLHRRLGATMVYVTHDQVEAMTMGDRIVVMRDGEVQQIAPPLELYNDPANLFVAGFIGSPSMNFVRGRVMRSDGARFVSDDGSVQLVLPPSRQDLDLVLDRPVTLGIRPEHLSTEPRPGYSEAPIPTQLEVVEPMGHEIVTYGSVGDATVVARFDPQPLPEPGSPLPLYVQLDRIHLFDSETGRRPEPVRSAAA